MEFAIRPGKRKATDLRLILYLLVLTTTLTAQVDSRFVYEFTRFAVSPMQTALGGSPIALATEDAAQATINPALMDSGSRQPSANIDFHFAGINRSTATDSVGKLPYYWATGLQYLSYGSFDGADEFRQLYHAVLCR